jgi:hypothetical protein
MLGFSIAGFAILLVFSSDRFIRIISEEGRSDSLYMKASITFVHFILVQVAGIFLGILGKIFTAIEVFAVIALFYAVATAVAACFVLFSIAKVYNLAANIDEDDGSHNDPDEDVGQSTRHRKVG